MKGLKIFGFVIAGILVLLAIGIALALTPAVQTWAVRRAVAGQPGMKLDLTRVAVGPSAADLSDIHFVKDGIVVTAKGVTARYSAWDYVSKKRINVDTVNIDELVVDLRNATPAKEPVPPKEKKQPFEGLLKEAQLPFDVRVAALSAKGKALLPGNQIVTFDLKGAGIENGQRGKLDWTVDFADSTAGAALRALRGTGNAAIHITTDRRIDSVELETIAAAMGPKLSGEQVKLVAKAAKPTATSDETYNATVGLIRGTAVEPLFKTDAAFAAATRQIAGSWELSVRTEQLGSLLAGFGLPELSANGVGKFTLKPDTNAVAASGNFQAQTAQLQKLKPELAAVGAVQVKSTFDGSFADNVARLDQLAVEVSGADGRKFADVSALQKIAYNVTDKRVTIADPKAELARISLQAIPLVWAQAFAQGMKIESGDLSMVLGVEAEPDGSRVHVRAVEPLAIRKVTISQDNKKLADQVTLTTKPTVDYSGDRVVAQLADFNVSMPSGDAVTGNLSADVTSLTKNPTTAFAAQLQVKVVAALKPYLPLDPGPLAIVAAVEGRHQGDTLELAKATSTVNRAGGALLTSFELQQPMSANLAKKTFTVPKPDASAARVKVGEIPLAWAEAFVPNSKFSGSLVGTTLELALRSLDDVTVTTTEPFVVRNVTAAMNGKPMAQALDLSATLSATKRGDAITYDLRKVEMKQGQTALLGLAVAGEAKLGKTISATAKGNLDADAAALLQQPMLAPFATLSRGHVTATFDANYADTLQAKAAISAKNLVAKQENRALGDLELTLTATRKADGSGTVSLPLTLTNANRKSDIAIDGTFGMAADQKTIVFAGKLASTQLIVDDFQPLAALAPASEQAKTTPTTAPGTRTPGTTPTTPAPRTAGTTPTPRPGVPTTTTPSTPPTRDTEPFWKGVNGKLDVDLKRVVYGKDYVISPVRGTAVVTNSKLSLDGLEGRFKENPFKLSGGVTFTASQPKPYTLAATADVQNFDVGAFLRAANPNEKPALETRATLSAKLAGNGGTVGELGKNAYGKFELTGSKGTMYLLERKGSAGTAVNAVALGLSVLGAARGSDTMSAVAEIAKLLNAVQFDTVKLQIERASDLSFKLSSLEVISPFMRMTGSGTVASKSTDDIQNAPMNIVLQLGAKDQLGYLLQRVNMLGINRDEKGYQLMTRTFTVGGTPSKPDSSALWKILGETAAGAFLR